MLDGASGGVNVYDDLKRTIPGVRFTSGFRTPEYQADMRRRGYNPASNSGHLDGSAQPSDRIKQTAVLHGVGDTVPPALSGASGST